MRHSGQPASQVLTEMSRRHFTWVTGSGIVALSTGALAAAAKFTAASATRADQQVSDRGRVVIVGAGTAGLTTAYRLHQAGVKTSVYEGSRRVGGRMFTEPNFNADGMFCERGGEMVDTQHTDLIALCTELGLAIQEVKNVPGAVTRDWYFIGGHMRSEEEVIAAFTPLAQILAKDIAALSPGGTLTVPTYSSDLAKDPLVQRLDRTSLAEYIHRSGADAWLKKLITKAYICEYGLEAAEQSAINLLMFIGADTSTGFHMLGSSDESKRIAGGSQSLPNTLAKLIQPSTEICFEHRLLAIVDHGGKFTLTFTKGSMSTVEVSADQVILALPVSMLRQVDLSGVELSPVKRRAIKEWGFGTNSKYMLGFNSRIWNSQKEQGGFACYSDTVAQEIWDTSRGQSGKSGILTAFLGGDAGRRVTPWARASLLKAIDSVVPGAHAAFDGHTLLQSWPNATLAKGSYTCCKPGHYTSIYGAPPEPELDGRLLLAGEHCSNDWSGFMNGAVQSGNQAAALVLAKAAR